MLTDDEKDLGVALVDIGAGTTDVAIFTDGAIRHTAVIPIAGDLITSDIAMALRTPTKDAEEIKVEYGVAKQLLADPNEQVEVPGLGDRAAAHAEPPGAGRRDRAAHRGDLLAGAAGDPRERATRSCCRQRHRASPAAAAVMPGMVELGEDIFLKPVRKGMPTYRGALSRHGGATALGHRDGPARGSAPGAHARLKAAQQAGSVKTAVRPRQGLVPGELLR